MLSVKKQPFKSFLTGKIHDRRQWCSWKLCSADADHWMSCAFWSPSVIQNQITSLWKLLQKESSVSGLAYTQRHRLKKLLNSISPLPRSASTHTHTHSLTLYFLSVSPSVFLTCAHTQRHTSQLLKCSKDAVDVYNYNLCHMFLFPFVTLIRPLDLRLHCCRGTFVFIASSTQIIII